MSVRQLIILRHAKAGPHTDTDHERELTDRGRRDAAAAGAHLARCAAVPDLALVSSAARTVQTWEAVAEAAGLTLEPTFSAALYAANARIVIELLRGIPADTVRPIFIGHNPTAEHLAHLLDDGSGDPSSTEAFKQGYPTAALTILDIEVPWSELSPDTGRISGFHVGRGTP